MEPQQPPIPPAPLFSAREEAGVHVITFSQPKALEAYIVEKLGEDILAHLKAFEAPRVVFDMNQVELLSSSALGVLISLNSLIQNAGGQLCLANVSEGLRGILEMTKLVGLLAIYESTSQAIKSLK